MSFKERFSNPATNTASVGTYRDVLAIRMPARPKGEKEAVEEADREFELRPPNPKAEQEKMRAEILAWNSQTQRAKVRLVEFLLLFVSVGVLGYFTNREFTLSVLDGLRNSAGTVALYGIGAAVVVALGLWVGLAANKPNFKSHQRVRQGSKLALYLSILGALCSAWISGAYDYVPLTANGYTWTSWPLLWVVTAGWLGGQTARYVTETLLNRLLPRHWRA